MEKVEKETRMEPLFVDIDPENPVTEIESICVECQAKVGFKVKFNPGNN
jgi:hypothetical protein